MSANNGITIIGTGNVAWHLAIAFKRVGVNINMIAGRNFSRAKSLAERVNSSFSDNFDDIPPDTSLALISVTDSALEEVFLKIKAKGFPMAHTSGSLPLSALGTNTVHTGVFYPFQTFTKSTSPGELHFPVCLEADNEEMKGVLRYYAEKISDTVVSLNSEQRAVLHISGIIANNFANHLFSQAFGFLEEHKIDSNLLLPIIEETGRKLCYGHPKQMQTGPAVRGNAEIVKKHLNLLKNHKRLQSIYELMSSSISEYYNDQML